MQRKRILIADDSPEIIELLTILLDSEGYEVITATDGENAVKLVDDTIDLIVLDVMMPYKSGFIACKEIREKTIAPILFLTAKDSDSDKAIGFSAGGDDYLSKPFSYPEFLARVKSLLRRYYVYQGKQYKEESNTLCIDPLCIDLNEQKVFVEEKEIVLTALEYRILVLMAKNRKKIFTAQNLYESIWSEPYFYSANNTIMVHILKLRKKIESDYKNPKIIKTAWGKGYYVD
ncbi:response regulator transcription factor [Sinanaerobacter sp. ZZT-01]|uniref:response regulator transcription factor n=1 Tax=Sinanaerobacter sp. ZZT-01 TaxID=3111540 RepID=UPI002D7981AE|nr:response regulator transcription factor [Sinanaerobacter sp. ZZT-01]WRR94517.1 response regulator transcription factor [Sinanaerobacter sp. ZZT-01]